MRIEIRGLQSNILFIMHFSRYIYTHNIYIYIYTHVCTLVVFRFIAKDLHLDMSRQISKWEKRIIILIIRGVSMISRLGSRIV